MTIEDLAQVQRIGHEILWDVVRICRKHNIAYFLMFGTLLGAVRHGSVIPWDDDVDIGMTRENYLKFLQVAPSELDPRNEITIMGSGDTRYLSELKVGRKNTWYYLEGTRDLKLMHQIQLDIFPVDHLKDLSPFQSKLCQAIRDVLMVAKLSWDEKKLIIRCIRESNHRGKAFYIAGLTCLHLLRLFPGERRIEKRIYHMLVDPTQTSDKMGVALLSGPVYAYPAHCFLSAEALEYEGRRVSVPADYRAFLQIRYGDYLQLPPEDRRYKKRFSRYVVEIEEFKEMI